jgi:hypothetical protein
VGISEQTFYRWKKQHVGLEIDQVRQFKQLQGRATGCGDEDIDPRKDPEGSRV